MHKKSAFINIFDQIEENSVFQFFLDGKVWITVHSRDHSLSALARIEIFDPPSLCKRTFRALTSLPTHTSARIQYIHIQKINDNKVKKLSASNLRYNFDKFHFSYYRKLPFWNCIIMTKWSLDPNLNSQVEV